jgi:uncharacterized protein (TIGR00290 family)
MDTRPGAIFCWSGGKDSAYCLDRVLNENLFEVRYLLTTLNAGFRRVSMHGVREELLDRQAESIGIPLLKVWVSDGSNEEYERQMGAVLSKAKSEGIRHVIFGDIFLEDLRAYRERNLAGIGMEAVFPLWQSDTAEVVGDFIRRGFKAIVCCTNDAWMGGDWTGRLIDEAFVKALPAGVDPCGENGEYHSFCFDGPIFKKQIGCTTGEKIFRPLEVKPDDLYPGHPGPVTRGFWYCELLPG